MDLQRLLNSQQGGKWALRISQSLPVRFGVGFSRFVANWISTKKELPLARAVRLNRWVVSGCQLNAAELDLAIRENIRHIALSYYFLFHSIQKPDKLRKLVAPSPILENLISLSKEGSEKMIVCGVHLSNFDLVLQAVAFNGLQAMAISLPETSENTEAVEWQNQFRRDSGVQIVPASLSGFRSAIRYLKEGGIVLTGIDRPIQAPKHRPVFFSHPSSLPVHHIHLALEAEAPLVLLAVTQAEDCLYHVHSSEKIHMRRFPDRTKEILWNANQLLEVAAEFIQMKPEQWSIFLPAWPEMMDKMP